MRCRGDNETMYLLVLSPRARVTLSAICNKSLSFIPANMVWGTMIRHSLEHLFVTFIDKTNEGGIGLHLNIFIAKHEHM